MTPTETLTGKVEEGSQEPECANLNSKAETVVISTALGNEQAIFVVEMKIAGELLRRWFANIASVTSLLLLGNPRDTQRGLSKRAEMRKVCFGGEWVILCHTESVLR